MVVIDLGAGQIRPQTEALQRRSQRINGGMEPHFVMDARTPEYRDDRAAPARIEVIPVVLPDRSTPRSNPLDGMLLLRPCRWETPRKTSQLAFHVANRYRRSAAIAPRRAGFSAPDQW